MNDTFFKITHLLHLVNWRKKSPKWFRVSGSVGQRVCSPWIGHLPFLQLPFVHLFDVSRLSLDIYGAILPLARSILRSLTGPAFCCEPRVECGQFVKCLQAQVQPRSQKSIGNPHHVTHTITCKVTHTIAPFPTIQEPYP